MKGNLPPASFPPNIVSVGPSKPHISLDGLNVVFVVVLLVLGVDVVVFLEIALLLELGLFWLLLPLQHTRPLRPQAAE